MARQLVTLAAGMLTALVALRNGYAAQGAQGLWLLKLSWAGLGLTVLCGMVALGSDVRSNKEAVYQALEGGLRLSEPNWLEWRAHQTMRWAFLTAVGSLMAFGVMN